MPVDVAERVCEQCGSALARPDKLSISRWSIRRFCSRRCSAAAMATRPLCGCGCGTRIRRTCNFVKGHRDPKRMYRGGYVFLWKPDHPLAISGGLVAEHRMVVYDAGITVPDGWHVHHRNGVKDDNRLENLEVLPPSEHHRHHIAEAGFVVNQYGVWPVRSTR